MIDFYAILDHDGSLTTTPFAGQSTSGDWMDGHASVEFLQIRFGHLSTATEMQAATNSDGLKRYFGWLADQGKLPR